MRYVCGKRVDTGEVVTLTIEAGRIADITAGKAKIGSAPVLGGDDVLVSPGWLDIQLNGYGGCDFNASAWGARDEVVHDPAAVFQKVVRSGTALLCPTITTNSAENIIRAMTALARALDADKTFGKAVPGIHLEGPYISSEDGARGAHPLEWTRDPDWDEFRRFQDAAGGRIRLCTLAPERDGALPFIEKLTASGVVVALGHTAASAQVIHDAVTAGARLSTHLGNGSHAVLPRHDNYVFAQLAEDDLYASLIADGFHLPAPALKVFARVKGAARTILVSDAVSLGGLPPGEYAGGRYAVLPTGKIVTAGTPYLAGAGYLLDTCIAHAARTTDFSLAEAIGCATAVPAGLLGLGEKKGRLDVGYDADLTLFRTREAGPLEIVATITGGEVAYP
jgi:N-acetylglucosamine-6-phosphate deacetylase